MNGSGANNLQIHHECPQCGGPVILDETDRFFSCNFCRVRLYLSSEDYFRYYIAPAGPITDEIFFLPYWRVRGLHYRLQSLKIHSKILDTSLIAADIAGIPRSLGLRAQALKLRFATSAVKAHFLRPSLPFSKFYPVLHQSLQSLHDNGPSSNTAGETFIGETISMIYAPFYIHDKSICDGLLRRPLAAWGEETSELIQNRESSRKWDIRFSPALCPDCGWDMEGEKNSVVLLCMHCDSSWMAEGRRFKKVEFHIVPSADRNIRYIPFWKIRASVKGISVASYADLITLANLPRAIQESWHERKIEFWCPAFTAHPRVFLRLAQQLTVSQPATGEAPRLPSNSLLPVTLSCTEAYESIYVTLANLATPKNRYFPMLRNVTIAPGRSTLVYLPFTDQGNEFIQPQLNFSINKNTFRII